MKNWIIVVAGVALLGTGTVAASSVSAKEPPQPAFGKELVPDQAAQKDPKAAEIEEELQEKEDEAGEKKRFRPPPRVGRGRRLHIQLDGDEDGGGGDESGEF